MDYPDSQRDFNRRIERQVAHLEQLQSQHFSKYAALLGHRQNPRLARTVVDSGADPTYPLPGSNVFPIVFLSGGFTDAAGAQTGQYTAHDTSPQAHVLCITGNYIPVGTVIQAWQDRGVDSGYPGEWWTPYKADLPTGVRFRNDSGESAPAYAVMRVTGGVVDGDEQIVTIAKPNDTFQRLYLVNGATAVADEEEGLGTWLDDAGYVLYESGSPAYGESWGAKEDQWSLAKWRPGFTIIGTVDGGSTEVWAQQDEVNSLIGKTTGSISANGGTGSINIWMGQAGSEAVTEYAITCSNLTSLALVTGKWGGVVWRNGNWYYEPWQCPT